MGSFYGNVTLLGTSLDEVRGAAPAPAFAAVDGDSVVLFAAADDEGSPTSGEALSSRLGCVAFSAAVHDDDILFFEVHDRGSAAFSGAVPDPSAYFELDVDDTELGGSQVDAAALVAALGRGDVEAVGAVLAADFVFASERHLALVRALSLPAAAVGWGYRYLAEDSTGYSGPPLVAL